MGVLLQNFSWLSDWINCRIFWPFQQFSDTSVRLFRIYVRLGLSVFRTSKLPSFMSPSLFLALGLCRLFDIKALYIESILWVLFDMSATSTLSTSWAFRGNFRSIVRSTTDQSFTALILYFTSFFWWELKFWRVGFDENFNAVSTTGKWPKFIVTIIPLPTNAFTRDFILIINFQLYQRFKRNTDLDMSHIICVYRSLYKANFENSIFYFKPIILIRSFSWHSHELDFANEDWVLSKNCFSMKLSWTRNIQLLPVKNTHCTLSSADLHSYKISVSTLLRLEVSTSFSRISIVFFFRNFQKY